MKKVLIISYSFPPLNNIAARRYGDMAKYFPENGWEPWILTTNCSGVLPVQIPGNRVIRIGEHHKNRSNELNNVSINKAKYQKKVLKIIKKLTEPLKFRFTTIDRTNFQWYKTIKSNEEELDFLANFDVIVASYGPPATIWIGKYLSKKFGIPWIADLRDLGALRVDNRNKLAIFIDMQIEKYVYKNVLGFTTVSNTLKKILDKNYGKPVTTIFNGWDSEALTINDSKTENSDKKEKYIYYAGSFYPHRMDSIKLLIMCLDELDEKVKLIIRSLGPVDLEMEIKEFAKIEGKSKLVNVLPSCDPHVVKAEEEGAILNVIFEDMNKNNEWSRGTLTGKFLQLLKQNKPILTIARSDSEIGEILLDTEKGELCSTTDEIISYINRILKNPNTCPGNVEKINQYSKKFQSQKMCDFLDRLILESRKANFNEEQKEG